MSEGTNEQNLSSFLLSSTKHLPMILKSFILCNIKKWVHKIAFINNIYSYILQLPMLVKELGSVVHKRKFTIQ